SGGRLPDHEAAAGLTLALPGRAAKGLVVLLDLAAALRTGRHRVSGRGRGIQSSSLRVHELHLALDEHESGLAGARAEAVEQRRLTHLDQVAGLAGRDGAPLDGLPDDEAAA